MADVIFTVTIPEAKWPTSRDALSFKWGYDPASGLTKKEFLIDAFEIRLREEIKRGNYLLEKETEIPPIEDQDDGGVIVT